MTTWAKAWLALVPEERKRLRLKLKLISTTPVSDLELSAIYLLERLGLDDYIFQYSIPTTRLRADFYFPRQNLIIETYGCGYHQCGECYPKPWKIRVIAKDEVRESRIKALGYKLLVIWGHELPSAERKIIDAHS